MKNSQAENFCIRINKIHRRLGVNKRIVAVNHLIEEFNARTVWFEPLVYVVDGKKIIQNTETLKFEVK